MPSPGRPLHLASASPRRREILEALGLEFTFAGVGIDETRLPGETPDAMVLRLAAAKAAAAVPQQPGCVIIGADTAVVLAGRIFGKPRDQADAAGMLESLSGREHDVLTAVATVVDGRSRSALSRSRVRFRDIRPDEAALYWQSGEPADKAGGYAVQGLGAVFVSHLAGSYSGVVGLPVFETSALLADAGIAVLRARAANRFQPIP